MAVTLRASNQGLQAVDIARRKRGWTKAGVEWCEAAQAAPASLKRFWLGRSIKQETFVAICKAVGIDWREVADLPKRAEPEDQGFVAKTAEPDEASVLRFGNVTLHQKEDWGEAPDVSSGFYGRMEELATLEQWIVKDRCRLVALLGIGGIGKTTLAARLAEQLRDRFEYVVIWRSLRHDPIHRPSLANQGTSLLEENVDERLIEYLLQHRCLVVLDNAETILRSGELLRRVGLERYHQSCLLLISREKTKEIAELEGETLPVRSYELRGLKVEDAKEILKAKGFSGSEPQIDRLINIYRGNPLALKIISITIKDLFAGNIKAFFNHGTLVISNIYDTLHEQFTCLTDLEKELMYWLAIKCRAVRLSELYSDILLPVSQLKLLEALESLLRRSLIEKETRGGEVLFNLQPTVQQYVVDQFVAQVCQELKNFSESKIETIEIFLQKLKFFRSYSFSKYAHEPDVSKNQAFFITKDIQERLMRVFLTSKTIEVKLAKILLCLREASRLEVGYALGNILNIFEQLGTDLSSYGFEGVDITDIKGLTEAQKATLISLGAITKLPVIVGQSGSHNLP